jgi:hypothetical protein
MKEEKSPKLQIPGVNLRCRSLGGRPDRWIGHGTNMVIGSNPIPKEEHHGEDNIPAIGYMHRKM